MCVCSIQCDKWKRKRTLVGIRWREPGKLFYEYRGVMTERTCGMKDQRSPARRSEKG